MVILLNTCFIFENVCSDILITINQYNFVLQLNSFKLRTINTAIVRTCGIFLPTLSWIWHFILTPNLLVKISFDLTRVPLANYKSIFWTLWSFAEISQVLSFPLTFFNNLAVNVLRLQISRFCLKHLWTFKFTGKLAKLY